MASSATTVIFVIMLTVILGLVYKIAQAVVHRQDEGYGRDETATIQELHRGLTRMEKRIEALETLLMEHCPDTASTTKR